MSGESPDYRPVKFLDRLEGNKHIVMLYDDQRYADLIIGRYFKNGLDNGESCVFFTEDEAEPVRRRLEAQGIEVEKCERENRLRIFRTERPSGPVNMDVLDILKNIRSASTKGMKGPFRFAGRTIMDTETATGMTQGMVVERTGQEHFKEFDNAQLCFYDVHKMEQSKKDQWISELLENHHQVIYASRPEKAVAFETMLLENEEE